MITTDEQQQRLQRIVLEVFKRKIKECRGFATVSFWPEDFASKSRRYTKLISRAAECILAREGCFYQHFVEVDLSARIHRQHSVSYDFSNGRACALGCASP